MDWAGVVDVVDVRPRPRPRPMDSETAPPWEKPATMVREAGMVVVVRRVSM